MSRLLRIGTRDSQLAVWQATRVQELLQQRGVASELVYMKSEGDVDTVTPLYALGVQGVFTKTLDAALLNNRIDIAVHSMKDVPTQLAQGIQQAAVLERASTKDIFVYKEDADLAALGYQDGKWSAAIPAHQPFTIGTGSVRRIAQWLHRYPQHKVENLRGNVNTRLQKTAANNWNGAIFAAAGLERIGLRPQRAVDLDWMLPAPAQGAIMIVCREGDNEAFDSCAPLNHDDTALCTLLERSFLKALMGGCSTPISALATIEDGTVQFSGNIVSPDGSTLLHTKMDARRKEAAGLGTTAAAHIISQGGAAIVESIRKNGLEDHGQD